MTRSHAKNNTTQANLTYYERSLLRKDGQAKRIAGDSFKPLDACYLCLSKVSDPVSCPSGHMYCRECAISNLLTQKAGIEVQKREIERYAANEEREREEARQKARDRVVSDFERGMGLGAGGVRAITQAKGDGEVGKFKFDQDAVERVAREAEEKAMRSIEAEQAEARKTKLPAFWLPSQAPEGLLAPLKDVKLETMCKAGEHPHPFSRRTLLPVVLTYHGTSAKPSCPSCTKELSNSTPSILLSSRRPANPAADSREDGDEPPTKKKKKSKKDKEDPFVCGHVICKTCSDTMVQPAGRCCICEAEVDDAGRIPLGKEGTGYAAAGGAEVKKSTIAFRV